MSSDALIGAALAGGRPATLAGAGRRLDRLSDEPGCAALPGAAGCAGAGRGDTHLLQHLERPEQREADLAGHVVGLWSSGQSGSCPGWLGSVEVDEETVKLVDVADLQGGGGCTDDFNPYSQVVVLDRAPVPPREALPVEGQLTSAIVTAHGTPPPGNGPVLRAVIRTFTR